VFRLKHRAGDGMIGIRCTRFLDDVIDAVDFVVPGAAVPVIVSGEVEHAWSFDVERDVVIVGQLIEEVAGVGRLVAAAPIVGAAHVSSNADALIGPTSPHAIGVEPDRDHRRFRGVCRVA